MSCTAASFPRNSKRRRELLPFNVSGVSLGYRLATSSPTSLSFSTGAYYHGTLDSYSFLTTIPIRHNVFVSAELDRNRYASALAGELDAAQTLERVAVDWQLTRFASFDLGLRRIVGRNLPNAFQTPSLGANAACAETNGYSPFDCVKAGNISIALHLLRASNELYAVYGNPNSLATQPTFVLKWIHYFGAQKGS